MGMNLPDPLKIHDPDKKGPTALDPLDLHGKPKPQALMPPGSGVTDLVAEMDKEELARRNAPDIEAEAERRRRGVTGRASTILTSPLGLTGQSPGARKVLLGA